MPVRWKENGKREISQVGRTKTDYSTLTVFPSVEAQGQVIDTVIVAGLVLAQIARNMREERETCEYSWIAFSTTSRACLTLSPSGVLC